MLLPVNTNHKTEKVNVLQQYIYPVPPAKNEQYTQPPVKNIQQEYAQPPGIIPVVETSTIGESKEQLMQPPTDNKDASSIAQSSSSSEAQALDSNSQSGNIMPSLGEQVPDKQSFSTNELVGNQANSKSSATDSMVASSYPNNQPNAAVESVENNFQQMSQPDHEVELSENYSPWKTYQLPSNEATVTNSQSFLPVQQPLETSENNQRDETSPNTGKPDTASPSEPSQLQLQQPITPQASNLGTLAENQPPGTVQEFFIPQQQTAQLSNQQTPQPSNNQQEYQASNVVDQQTIPQSPIQQSMQVISVRPQNPQQAVTEAQYAAMDRSQTATTDIFEEEQKPLSSVKPQEKIEYPKPKNFGFDYLMAKKKTDLMKQQNQLIWKTFKDTPTKYPKPEPLTVKTTSMKDSSSKHEITAPNNQPNNQPVKLKVTFKKNSQGKYEMKLNGPYDQFGRKVDVIMNPNDQANTKPKPHLDYENLTKEDRIKLLKQSYRELKMEEERKAYPLKYIPPNNRAYLAPPGQNMKPQNIKRPVVQLTKTDNKQNMILTTHLPSSDSRSKVKTLSIKLPVNVSLATVLKNIYEHMYEYYFHKRPLMNSNREDAAVRKVIQGLVEQDVKNISRIVNSDRHNQQQQQDVVEASKTPITTTTTAADKLAVLNNYKTKAQQQRLQATKNLLAQNQNVFNSAKFMKPNTIYTPTVATNDQFLGMNPKYLKALYYKKLYNDRLKMLSQLRPYAQTGMLRSPVPQNTQTYFKTWNTAPSSLTPSFMTNVNTEQAYERMLPKKPLNKTQMWLQLPTTVKNIDENKQPYSVKSTTEQTAALPNITPSFDQHSQHTVSSDEQLNLYNKLTSRDGETTQPNMLSKTNTITQVPTENMQAVDDTSYYRRSSQKPHEETTLKRKLPVIEDGVGRSNIVTNKLTTTPLSGALESHLETVEFLKKAKRKKEANELMSVILNTPLSVIADEHTKRKSGITVTPNNRPTNIKGPSLFHAGGTVNEVHYNTPSQNSTPFSSQKSTPFRHIINETRQVGAKAMTSKSNYFLIDTSGVADNKPMVIESPEEYFEKQQQKLKNKTLNQAKKTTNNTILQQPSNTVPQQSFNTVRASTDPQQQKSSPKGFTTSADVVKSLGFDLPSHAVSENNGFTNPPATKVVQRPVTTTGVNSDQTSSGKIISETPMIRDKTPQKQQQQQTKPLQVANMKTRYIPPIRHVNPVNLSPTENKLYSRNGLVQYGMQELNHAVKAMQKQPTATTPKITGEQQSSQINNLPMVGYQTIIEEPSILPEKSEVIQPFNNVIMGNDFNHAVGQIDDQFSPVHNDMEAYNKLAMAKGSAYTVNEEITAEKEKQGILQSTSQPGNKQVPQDDPDWDKKHTISFDSDIVSRSFTPRQNKEQQEYTIVDNVFPSTSAQANSETNLYDTYVSTRSFIPRPIINTPVLVRGNGLSGANKAPRERKTIVSNRGQVRTPMGYNHEIGSKDHAELRTVFDSLMGPKKVILSNVNTPSTARSRVSNYFNPYVEGKGRWNVDQVLLRRQHHLHRRIKQMKRQTDQDDTVGTRRHNDVFSTSETSKRHRCDIAATSKKDCYKKELLRRKRHIKQKHQLKSKVKSLLKQYETSHSKNQVKQFLSNLHSKFNTQRNTGNRKNETSSKKTVKKLSTSDHSKHEGMKEKHTAHSSTLIGNKVSNSTLVYNASKDGKAYMNHTQISNHDKSRMFSNNLNDTSKRKVPKSSETFRKLFTNKDSTKKDKKKVLSGKQSEKMVKKAKELPNKVTKELVVTSQKHIDEKHSPVLETESITVSEKPETIGKVFHDVQASKKSIVILDDIRLKQNKLDEKLFSDDAMMMDNNAEENNIGQKDSFTQSMEKYKKSSIPPSNHITV